MSQGVSNQQLGVALCGGGARGAAHIGVLKALEERGISPNYISGASAGAIVAAFYASGLKPAEIQQIISKSSLFKVFNLRGGKHGFNDLSYLQRILKAYIPTDNFSSLKKKLFVGATNLNSGEFEILQKGAISPAVMASCAIPFIFKPVKLLGATYVDGGLTNNLPVEPLIANCHKIIGVNVNRHHHSGEVKDLQEIGLRCFHILLWNNTHGRLQQCDIPLEISGAFNYGLFDFSSVEEIAAIGYYETKKKIESIISKL